MHNFEILFRIHLFKEWGPWSVWRPRVAAAVVTRTVNTVMSLLRFINIPRMPPRPYHHHHRPAPTSKTQFSTAADWASPFLWVYDLNTFLLQAAGGVTAAPHCIYTVHVQHNTNKATTMILLQQPIPAHIINTIFWSKMANMKHICNFLANGIIMEI